jgi:hypothetical protein
MIQIAFMGICAAASIFLLTFLKALLQDSRDHAQRHAKGETKAVAFTPRRRGREAVTTRAA